MPCSKKVFVTGATGLIGKELLLPLTQAGFDVFALTIEDNNPAVSGVHWIKGNLFDEAFIALIEYGLVRYGRLCYRQYQFRFCTRRVDAAETFCPKRR